MNKFFLIDGVIGFKLSRNNKIKYFKGEKINLVILNKIISREDTVSEKIYFEILKF